MRKNQNNNKQNTNIQNKESQNPNKLVPAIVSLELKILPRSCSLEQFVEVLLSNDIYLNIIQLVMWLHYEDFINIDERAPRESHNPITKKSKEEGLLVEKETMRTKSNGAPIKHSTLMVTCKGQCYFLNKLINRGIGCK